MTDGQTTSLGGVFADILARLAFMFGEPAAGDELSPPAGGALCAEMAFRGPRRGTLALAAPPALAGELAANVLGLEPDDVTAAAGAADALQELLNVTCGHVLTALAGDEPVFDLDAPATRPLDAAAWRALHDAPGTAGFVVEGRPVLLRLDLAG